MKKIVIWMALAASAAGAALWTRDSRAQAPLDTAAVPVAKAASDDAPRAWAMLLAGAVVVCFVAARRAG